MVLNQTPLEINLHRVWIEILSRVSIVQDIVYFMCYRTVFHRFPQTWQCKVCCSLLV